MKRTFIDAGVLIAAARGEAAIASRAMDILDDPDREFASSEFVRLEVLPKAIYYQRQAEAAFYQLFFNSVKYWAGGLETIVQDGYQEACQAGLSAMDALHVAAAVSVQAEEFITVERPEKSLHRTSVIKVTSLQAPG